MSRHSQQLAPVRDAALQLYNALLTYKLEREDADPVIDRDELDHMIEEAYELHHHLQIEVLRLDFRETRGGTP